MPECEGTSDFGEDGAVVAAIQNGRESTFSSLAEPHRKELEFTAIGCSATSTMPKIWCRRRLCVPGEVARPSKAVPRSAPGSTGSQQMLASTRSRPRSADQVVEVGPTTVRSPSFDEVPWLQPFPDELVPGLDEPDALVVAKETIELAFLAAVQHLSPRPRAVLILRDVLGWTASETADALDHRFPVSTVHCSGLGLVCKSSGSLDDWSGHRCSLRQRRTHPRWPIYGGACPCGRLRRDRASRRRGANLNAAV